MAGEVLTRTKVHLDWSDPSHWAEEKADCRICGTPTNGLDGQGLPCHQSCAEDELAAERAAHAGVLVVGPEAEQAGMDGFWVVDERVTATEQQQITNGEASR